MTFNQWCAGNNFDSSLRLAFEAVWNALTEGGASPSQASRLLSDVVEALPDPEECDCDEEDF